MDEIIISGGLIGSLAGMLTPSLDGMAAWVGAISSVGCLIGTAVGIGLRIYDAVKRYKQGKITAKQAQEELMRIDHNKEGKSDESD